ncbi:hypothetical protein HOC37_04670 [bacterium]|jgi:hypothetical protein|nr:hypothetical protein [bacterium]
MYKIVSFRAVLQFICSRPSFLQGIIRTRNTLKGCPCDFALATARALFDIGHYVQVVQISRSFLPLSANQSEDEKAMVKLGFEAVEKISERNSTPTESVTEVYILSEDDALKLLAALR